MTGDPDMHDPLGLIQYHDQYFCSNISLQPPPVVLPNFLAQEHPFLDAQDRCTGANLTDFVEQATATASKEHGSLADRPLLCSENSEDGEGIDEGGKGRARNEEEVRAMRMISLLMEGAAAMSVDNMADANRILLELTQMASPYALSCAERLVAYFTKAMAARLMSSWLGICAPLVTPYTGIHVAFRAYYDILPFVRLAHLVCNRAILEAFHGKHCVHIVDLDVVPGGALQWLSLLPALAAQPGGAPYVRMTGFGASVSVLHDSGNQLASLARTLSMPFEFYAIPKRPGDADMVTDIPIRRPGEAVAVHWLRHAMYDAAGDDNSTMRLVQFLEPKVVTLVEQERGGEGGHFLDRFVAALHFYSAAFDSLGVSRPDIDDASRHLVEHAILGREISNVLAVGGPARSGEEKFGSWRTELPRHGFMPVVAGDGAGMAVRTQLVLTACPPGMGYVVDDGQDGTVRLGWKGTTLYTVSAWAAGAAFDLS